MYMYILLIYRLSADLNFVTAFHITKYTFFKDLFDFHKIPADLFNAIIFLLDEYKQKISFHPHDCTRQKQLEDNEKKENN